jgi:hypothetical protein
MYVHVNNENYGYEVVTHDDWVVVGNPTSFKYEILSGSMSTGSIDIFKYNTLTDQHDLLLTLYRGLNGPDQVLLAEDPDATLIHTDVARRYILPIYSPGGIHWFTYNLGDIPIQIDASAYVTPLEDDYGHALDVYNNILAVGCRWFLTKIQIEDSIQYLSGSSVDIFNLTALHSTFYDGNVSTGSGFFVTTIPSPVGEPITGSFGYSVSINDEWLAVGSPTGSANGAVYMYRRTFPADPNNIDFTLFATLTGSSCVPGDQFGAAIDLNKQTGSYSGSLLVGCGRNTVTSSLAYFFEFDGVSWQQKNVFAHDLTPRNLAYYDVLPINRDPENIVDSYGNSVALWENDAAVGAPTDRVVYEYSGSHLYNQGAAYIYHRCDNRSLGWYLVEKTYGNEKVLKNNKFAFSLGMWGDYLAIGSPKFNLDTVDSCYEEGSVWQNSYCYTDSQNYIQGQWVLYERNTSSLLSWDILNVYQKKKRFLSPYRAFGFDIDIANKSVVVGAPLLLSDDNRDINIQNTSSIQGEDILDLDDFSGKAYIYNLKNLRDNFHVGNVFYRNGKIVLNTSGSLFDGLWYNSINKYNYEYEVHFDSKQTLYEKQIACVVEPGEFNTSQNPTALIRTKAIFDINSNGYFDWQDLDVILRYMQGLNTRYSQFPTLDWSSSLLKTDEEVSYYNFQSTHVSTYNTNSDYISQSFFQILNNIGIQSFDFNQDSKVDLNDMNIFWKYSINRLNQLNYQSYITPNSQRRLFSDIVDHLNYNTQKTSAPQIKPEFLTFNEQSRVDKTGSYLAPYVTTIGLYNGLDLIAVAKLGSPIKLTGDYPINFMVKMDF